MTHTLPASTSLLALAATAAPVSLADTGGLQAFTAANAGACRIPTSGAQDGGGFGFPGGLGAEIGGFMPTAGEVLTIAAGGGVAP